MITTARKISIVCFVLLSMCSHAHFVEVAPDVFAAEAKSPAGAQYYVGIERVVDEQQKNAWRDYSKSADWLTIQGSGVLRYSAINSTEERKPKYEVVKKTIGFDEEGYDQIMAAMKRLELFKPANRAAMSAVPTGTVAFQTELARKNVYVAYISKKPISGKFAFKKFEKPELGRVDSLKEYFENYDDIVMCMVIINYPGKPITEHRGIFRNPTDFLDVKKLFAGSSLPLHGAGASFASLFLDDKRYVAVIPVEAMENILVAKVQPGDMFIGTNKSVKLKHSLFPPIIH